jgi:hypothetical protein
MSAANIEKRIEALEREVRLLKRQIRKSKSDQKPWWERLAGAFKDDPVFDEIVEAGRKYRKSQRPPVSRRSE